MSVLEALRWRYAVKAFADKKLPETAIRDLVEVVRLSPSAYGLQPYSLLVIDSEPIRRQLLRYSMGQDKVLNSSHLFVFATQTELGDGTVDRYLHQHHRQTGVAPEAIAGYADHMKAVLRQMSAQQRAVWAAQQAYIGLGNLLTSAALMRIDACPMTGFEAAGYDQVLGLTDRGLTTTVICPVGYRSPGDGQAEVPKVRFDYQQLLAEL